MNIQYNSKEWLVWEQNCAPFFLCMTLNPSFKELREYFGSSLFTTLIDFGYDNNGVYVGKWLLRTSEGMSLGQKMTDFLSVPVHRNHFIQACKKAEKELIQKADEIRNFMGISDLSDDELISMYKSLETLFYSFYKFGAFVEPLQWYTEAEIKKYIDARSEDNNKDFDIMKIVTVSSEESFPITIQKGLLNCSRSLKNVLNEETELVPFFENGDASGLLENISKKDSKACKDFIGVATSFCSEYYWQRNNYYSTYEYGLIDVITDILKESKDVSTIGLALSSKLVKYEEDKVHTVEKKKQLLDELSAYYKSVVELLELSIILQDTRKRLVMKSNSSFDVILSEISKRTSVELNKIHLLLPQEIEQFFKDPMILSDLISLREESFFVVQSDIPIIDEVAITSYDEEQEEIDPQKIKILPMLDPYYASGAKEVNRLLAKIDRYYNLLLHSSKGDILNGIVTYKKEDQIVGIAHVIKDAKNEEIQEDEILVAPSTTPDYLVSINRCKAIITDWGGQTSHAAIVSRELQKPCIIGTGFASECIRTGDRIKVDFVEGTITVLDNVQ